MLTLNDIQQQYQPRFQFKKRFILREYLQYKILEAIANSPESRRLVFMGGTAIRLVYNSRRFSEDLNFDNLGLTANQFQKLFKNVQHELSLEGIVIELRFSFKEAMHCFLRFVGLLQAFNLTKQKKEKIMIRVDAAPQNYDYQPDLKLLKKFDVYTRVQVAPQELLLAEKLITILRRSRAKGRDFFDVIFLAGETDPEWQYLRKKAGIGTREELKTALRERLHQLDMPTLAKEVEPFLIKSSDFQQVLSFAEFVEDWL
jgi:predicted nucleotidyltransferase component of viral defense system